MGPAIFISSLLLAAAPAGASTDSQTPAITPPATQSQGDAAARDKTRPRRVPGATGPASASPNPPPRANVDPGIQLPTNKPPEPPTAPSDPKKPTTDSVKPSDDSIIPVPPAPSAPGQPGVRPL